LWKRVGGIFVASCLLCQIVHVLKQNCTAVSEFLSDIIIIIIGKVLLHIFHCMSIYFKPYHFLLLCFCLCLIVLWCASPTSAIFNVLCCSSPLTCSEATQTTNQTLLLKLYIQANCSLRDELKRLNVCNAVLFRGFL